MGALYDIDFESEYRMAICDDFINSKTALALFQCIDRSVITSKLDGRVPISDQRVSEFVSSPARQVYIDIIWGPKISIR